jgi:molybdate transport system permease protein
MSALFVALCLLFVLPSSAFAWAAGGQAQDAAEPAVPEVSRTGAEARLDGAAFGIVDFERLNKGTSREYEGRSFGYRYPMVSEDAFAVVVIDERTALVYLPQNALSLVGSETPPPGFEEMLEALDVQASKGGAMLTDMSLNYRYTTERSMTLNGVRYSFAVEVEPGYYYATIAREGSGGVSNSSDGTNGANNDTAVNNGASADSVNDTPSAAVPTALFCETGRFINTSEVVIEKAPTGFAALAEFLTSLDLRPFWVSLRTSAVAMLFVFVLGLLAAWLSQRINSRLKGILDSIFTIPMVLPPTVCGFLLLILFGNSTKFGQFLLEYNIQLIFSWPAAVLAAIVVSFPLMYRTARGAFEGLDPALGDAARTLGWSEWRIFRTLSMPLAWPSIAAGTVLAFARAMGEFGATLFVAGNYPGVTQTMPIAIYFEWMGGHSDVATFWVFVVILFSFVVILFVNWYAAHTQRYRRAGSDGETETKTKEDGSPVLAEPSNAGDGGNA